MESINLNDKPEVVEAKKSDEQEQPEQQQQQQQSSHSSDYAPYPKLNPSDVAPPPPPPEGWGTFVDSQSESQPQSDPVTEKPESPPVIAKPAPTHHKTVSWSPELTRESPSVPESTARTMPSDSNPYVSASPSSSAVVKNTVDSVKDTIGRWGKKVGETTKKAEDLVENVWQHLKTGPSVADAAMGRIAQSTKVLTEGGYEKVFQQTFEGVPEEQLRKSFACFLSTSAGPVMGVLYLSTAKLAFCSDNPLQYKIGDQTEWSYYKVVIPLHQLKAVNPSVSKSKPVEKYIQVVSVDNHEFWFMAFVNYDAAIRNLQEALQAQSIQSV